MEKNSFFVLLEYRSKKKSRHLLKSVSRTNLTSNKRVKIRKSILPYMLHCCNLLVELKTIFVELILAKIIKQRNIAWLIFIHEFYIIPDSMHTMKFRNTCQIQPNSAEPIALVCTTALTWEAKRGWKIWTVVSSGLGLDNMRVSVALLVLCLAAAVQGWGWGSIKSFVKNTVKKFERSHPTKKVTAPKPKPSGVSYKVGMYCIPTLNYT